MAADHNYFANLIWQIADLLRGPYRPPQYERVMLPMTVLRRFDCVLAETKPKVVAAFERSKGGKIDISQEHIKKWWVPLPPLDEQRRIVAHTARETAKFGNVRGATMRTIELLKERRAALIAAAVTEQLDVEAAA